MEKMVNVRMNISRKIFFVFMILTVITLLFGMSASAINAADYAPFFYFEAEEDYFPVDVDYHLTNCDLYQYDKVGDEEIKTLVKSNPSVNEIASYTNDDSEYSFLDNKLGNVDDDSGILGSYRNYKDIYGFKIYYFIEPGSTSDSGAIQYWMFYAFNKGDLNRHEGDWEMVRVEVDSDGYKQVGYSQHHSGQKGN